MTGVQTCALPISSIQNQEGVNLMEPSINSTQKQHVDLYKKLLLRKQLLRHAVDGACFVPYCGDGDIASKVYSGRKCVGVDIDEKKIAHAKQTMPDNEWYVGDVEKWDKRWGTHRYCIADFDAYNDPYKAFKIFWQNATTTQQVVLLFTDGLRQSIIRSRIFRGHKIASLNEQRKMYNMYFPIALRIVTDIMHGTDILKKTFYLRYHMLYWGIVIKRNG